MRRSLVVSVALSLAFAQGASGQKATLARAGNALERVAQARAARKVKQEYDPVFKKYTKRYFGPNVDWRYFKAQGFAESGLTANATSRVGARGVMQLMPSTYQMIASRRPEFGPIDQPEWNIAAGIMHDRYLWTLWKDLPDDERYRFMFASYNAGEGTINRARAVAKNKVGSHEEWANIEQIAPTVQRWRYSETLGYVRRIDSTYTSFGMITP